MPFQYRGVWGRNVSDLAHFGVWEGGMQRKMNWTLMAETCMPGGRCCRGGRFRDGVPCCAVDGGFAGRGCKESCSSHCRVEGEADRDFAGTVPAWVCFGRYELVPAFPYLGDGLRKVLLLKQSQGLWPREVWTSITPEGANLSCFCTCGICVICRDRAGVGSGASRRGRIFREHIQAGAILR